MVLRQHLARAGLLAITMVFAASLWISVWRPAMRLRQVGVSGILPENGRLCETAKGGRWRHCYGGGPNTAHRVDLRESVSLDRYTRRVSQVERAWTILDSSDAARQFDSVALALQRAGGERIGCVALVASNVGQTRIAAWRFRDQDVRVLSTRLAARDGQPRWQLQVYGAPVGYSGCQTWAKHEAMAHAGGEGGAH